MKSFKDFLEELGGGTPPTNSTGPNVCTDPDTVVVKKKRNAWNKGKKYMKGTRTVSYTHLTLPTNREV